MIAPRFAVGEIAILVPPPNVFDCAPCAVAYFGQQVEVTGALHRYHPEGLSFHTIRARDGARFLATPVCLRKLPGSDDPSQVLTWDECPEWQPHDQVVP